MVIQTYWPGADAKQVQEQVTDRIARKLQEPADRFPEELFAPGESLIFFNIKDSAPAARVRRPGTRCARSRRHRLPAAAGVRGPYFNDEFGDVYTNVYALEAMASRRRNCMTTPISCAPSCCACRRGQGRLLRRPEPAHFHRAGEHRLSKLGISVQQIAQAIGQQNAVAAAGVITPPMIGYSCGPAASSTAPMRSATCCCASTTRASPRRHRHHPARL